MDDKYRIKQIIPADGWWAQCSIDENKCDFIRLISWAVVSFRQKNPDHSWGSISQNVVGLYKIGATTMIAEDHAAFIKYVTTSQVNALKHGS